MTEDVVVFFDTGDMTGAAMNALLADAGLLPLVEADLCLFSSVEGIDKSRPAFFTRGSDRAHLPALHLVETELAPPTPG